MYASIITYFRLLKGLRLAPAVYKRHFCDSQPISNRLEHCYPIKNRFDDKNSFFTETRDFLQKFTLLRSSTWSILYSPLISNWSKTPPNDYNRYLLWKLYVSLNVVYTSYSSVNDSMPPVIKIRFVRLAGNMGESGGIFLDYMPRYLLTDMVLAL